MQTNYFDNPEDLTNYIARIADPATSWEKEGISLSDLDQLIQINRRLILAQTENADTAPKLKKSLFNLSKRIEESETTEGTPEGRSLAFEVTSIALGIFSEGERPDWRGLPHEVLQVIFSQARSGFNQSGLDDSSKVSKEWKENAEIVKKNSVEEGIISLRTYGCNSAKEAVQCIIDKKLLRADLAFFYDLTDTELTKLIKSCPGLNYLGLGECKKIKNFPLGELTNLKTLNLYNCVRISEEVFLKELTRLRQLTSLDLTGCYQFTQIESIKDLSELKHLVLSFCKNIPEDMLLESLKNLNLTSLNLSWCDQITGNNLGETLKSLSKLTDLTFIEIKYIPGNVLADALKKVPQLTHLDISYSKEIPEDSLAEIVKNLPKLTHLNLIGCSINELPNIVKNHSQLTKLSISGITQLDQVLKNLPQLKEVCIASLSEESKESVVEWRKQYPNIKFTDPNDFLFWKELY